MPVLSNSKHEAFAQAIAKGKTQDEAYAAAGYKPHRSSASRLRTKANIEARVAELLSKGADRAEIDIARTLRELVRIGTADLRQGFDADGRLKPVAEWSDDFAAAVASIEVVTRTLPGEAEDELDAQPHGGALARKRNARVEHVHKIKFWDKNSALEKIAKHLGMFIERVHHSGNISHEDALEQVWAWKKQQDESAVTH